MGNNKARCQNCEGKLKIVWEREYNPKMHRNSRYCASTRADIYYGSLICVKKDVWKRKRYVCLECKEGSYGCFGSDESKVKQEDSPELIKAMGKRK